MFLTLSTRVKKAHLKGFKKDVLMLDTIGFITNLPHELISSFKATIDEIRGADLILHIVDVSNPNWELQRSAVYRVLTEIVPDLKDVQIVCI